MTRVCLVAALAVLVFSIPAGAGRKLSAVCDQWPPYEYAERSGPVTGISAAIVREVLKGMDTDVSMSIVPWKRALDMVRHGNADLVFSANRGQGREGYCLFPAEPLAVTTWSFWTRGKAVKSMRDLTGLRVGLVAGFAYVDGFRETVGSLAGSVEEVVTDDINLRKLLAGRLDVIVGDDANISWLDRGKRAVRQPLVLARRGIYAAFSRKTVDKGFVKRFSQALATYKKTEAYRRLLEPWPGVFPVHPDLAP